MEGPRGLTLRGIFWVGCSQVHLLSKTVGQSKSSPPCKDWLEGVLGRGMADAFAEMWPDQEGRFTCWDQYRNKRSVLLSTFAVSFPFLWPTKFFADLQLRWRTCREFCARYP